MRAREFVINVPITIKINGDSDPEISTTDASEEETELSTLVPPLQQKIEIMKRNSGLPNAFDDQENDEDEPFE